MTSLRKSPFKADRIEDDPKAFGLRPESVISCADALYNGKNVLISGERGIGKSSLANQLATVFQGDYTLLNRCDITSMFPKCLCGYTFCTSGTTLSDLSTSILYNLEQQYSLLKSLRPKSTKVALQLDLKIFTARIESEIATRTPGTIAAEFASGLSVALQSARQVGLDGINVVIDEIDELDGTINVGRFMKDIHERLQNLRVKQFITFTLTGQRGVFERLYSEEKAFERGVRHVPISTLSADESRHILTYAADNSECPFAIDADAQDMILGLATGYPYAIHLIGDAAFSEMTNSNRMTRSDVLRGLLSILQSDKAEKYVVHLKGLNDDERLVLMSMSLYPAKTIPAQVPADWVEPNLLGSLPEEALVNVLDKLIVGDYLVRGPKAAWYSFRDELFRIFLSHFVFTHREREEEARAKRRQRLDALIGRQRRGDIKRYLEDFRETLAKEPDMLDYTIELLNVADYDGEHDWEHLQRRDLAPFE